MTEAPTDADLLAQISKLAELVEALGKHMLDFDERMTTCSERLDALETRAYIAEELQAEMRRLEQRLEQRKP